MQEAIAFWLESCQKRYFVRWTILDKPRETAIGTVEEFHRHADDAFDHCCGLRVDVKSEYENAEDLTAILNLIVKPTFDLFTCREVITKIPVYAAERMKAVKRVGFAKSEELLIGIIDVYAYKDYWTRIK